MGYSSAKPEDDDEQIGVFHLRSNRLELLVQARVKYFVVVADGVIVFLKANGCRRWPSRYVSLIRRNIGY